MWEAGWSLDCLQEWGPFVRLAIPSMLMLCLEWWLFEVGAFLAGQISEAELGAQSIAYELTVVAYMVEAPNPHGPVQRPQKQNDEPCLPCRCPWACPLPPASESGTRSAQENPSRQSCRAKSPWRARVRTRT